MPDPSLAPAPTVEELLELCPKDPATLHRPRPPADRGSFPGRLACALGLGLALACAGCCALSAADRALIGDMQAANLGDAQDEALPPEARAIGQDNYDAWSQLRRAIEGTPLPPEVRARHEARRAAADGDER